MAIIIIIVVVVFVIVIQFMIGHFFLEHQVTRRFFNY